MENTVRQRLESFLELKKISKSEFGRLIGVSSAYITSMRKSIQPDKVKSIALNFPELNINWLLTGNGEMLKENIAVTPQPSSDEMELYKKLIASLEETVASQKMIIQKLQTELIKLQRANIYQRNNKIERRAASAIPPDMEPA